MSEPQTQPTPSADQFQKWFFRAVQLGGYATIGHEVIIQDGQRPWVLLTAGGMMLGFAGIQLIVKWGLRKFGGSE